MGMIIFITVVLLAYGGINFLILSKVRQALAGKRFAKGIILSALLFCILAYPAGRIAQAHFPGPWSDACIQVGSFYLGIMTYAFLVILLFEAVWFIARTFHWIPAFVSRDSKKSLRVTALGTAIVILGTVFWGYMNARTLHVRRLNITIGKKIGRFNEFRIVVASDIHIGTFTKRPRLEKIVRTINDRDPDLVLLPGDLLDDVFIGDLSLDAIGVFKKMRSRFGVYAVTGNHEYFLGVKKAVAFIRTGNITVLEDTAITVANALCLIGRKDRMANPMGDHRKPLNAILKNCDPTLPRIVMDHQPIHLNEAVQNHVDLQISGHTHNGQIFPFTLVAKALYEKSRGYLQKGNTQFYVSSGVGTWGPPLRIGSTPEIVEIILKFDPQFTVECMKAEGVRYENR